MNDDVTQFLAALQQGDPTASEKLLPLVYDELRKLAAVRIAHEAPGQTLQATALVHEAFLRLVGTEGDAATWDSRGHFFAAAAEAMRRILVEAARRKRQIKRGGGVARVEYELADIEAPAIREDLIELDQALDALKLADPRAYELVQLRYFAGLTLEEAADVLQVSSRSADRLWSYARVWLRRAMRADERSK